MLRLLLEVNILSYNSMDCKMLMSYFPWLVGTCSLNRQSPRYVTSCSFFVLYSSGLKIFIFFNILFNGSTHNMFVISLLYWITTIFTYYPLKPSLLHHDNSMKGQIKQVQDINLLSGYYIIDLRLPALWRQMSRTLFLPTQYLFTN